VDRPRLNPKFPACANVARRLLAEVYGCKPGDLIPGEEELLACARQAIAAEREAREARRSPVVLVGDKAQFAVAMVEEIGGIFERPESGHEKAAPAAGATEA
jgi:hypothetical protein